MFGNYLKTAFRSLLKNSAFTFINILGLALGLCTCLLIMLYVGNELSYDHYNKNYRHIYRLNTDLKLKNTVSSFANAPAPSAPALLHTFPQVVNYVRLTPALNIHFAHGRDIFNEDNAIYAEPSVFSIFTLPFIHGDPKTALNNPKAIVIDESTARKYFNHINVVGKTLLLTNDSSAYKITGVMRDMPRESHFKANVIMKLNEPKGGWNGIPPLNTYILLRPDADINRLAPKFSQLMARNLSSASFDYKKFEAHGNYMRLSVTPLADIHLHSNRINELGANGNDIYIFSAVALFILALACINFMNLSTARSANRAREVGVRKVLGSSRKQLIAQFLSESLLVTFAASTIAVLMAWALLPVFNRISGKEMAITLHSMGLIVPLIAVITLVVGTLAGAYPAFFLSGFQPVNVLKGKLATGFRDSALRGVLVVVQFGISIFLIIGTFVVYGQLSYIQDKDLGFNRNHVLIIKNAHELNDPELFRQEVKNIPGVIDATLSNHVPAGDKWPEGLLSKDNAHTSLVSAIWQVDEGYIATMGLKLLKGRNFSKDFSTDTSAAIINETAEKQLGYGHDVLNQPLNGLRKYHIIGVVKDFNFKSLRENMSPLALVMEKDWMASLDVRVSTPNIGGLIEAIRRKWNELGPGHTFDYTFLDQRFNEVYKSEQRMGQLFIVFAALALVIACLGLFALAAYAAEQRNREISIRKILGANISSLVTLLSKDFINLVVMAIIIALPLAWWTMQKWLQGFAYRQNIQWWVFASAGLGALFIAFATISFQSFKAASAKPVDSLRGE